MLGHQKFFQRVGLHLDPSVVWADSDPGPGFFADANIVPGADADCSGGLALAVVVSAAVSHYWGNDGVEGASSVVVDYRCGKWSEELEDFFGLNNSLEGEIECENKDGECDTDAAGLGCVAVAVGDHPALETAQDPIQHQY